MSSATESTATAQVPEGPAPKVDWLELDTSISCLAYDMADLRKEIEKETDEKKKAELLTELKSMEEEYVKLLGVYQTTPRTYEEEDSYDDWACDYENGQGCADW